MCCALLRVLVANSRRTKFCERVVPGFDRTKNAYKEAVFVTMIGGYRERDAKRGNRQQDSCLQFIAAMEIERKAMDRGSGRC